MPHPPKEIVDLVEKIYDAAIDFRKFKDFLENLASFYPSGRGLFFHHDSAARTSSFSFSTGWQPHELEYLQSNHGIHCPWMRKLPGRPVGLVAPAEAMAEKAELRGSDFYHDLLRPCGLETAVGVTLARDERRFTLASVVFGDRGHDSARKVDVDLLAAVTPHLQRALLIGRHLSALGTIRTAWEAALDGLGIGVVLVGPCGLIRFANGVAEQILRAGGALTSREGRLATRDPRALGRLRRMVLACAMTSAGDSLASGGVISAPAGDRPPLRLLIVPIRQLSASVVGHGPCALILISDPVRRGTIPINHLGELYNLTGKERSVLEGMMLGHGVEEMATRRQVGTETIRSQLKAVLHKTGCRRQVDLLRLLAREYLPDLRGIEVPPRTFDTTSLSS